MNRASVVAVSCQVRLTRGARPARVAARVVGAEGLFTPALSETDFTVRLGKAPP